MKERRRVRKEQFPVPEFHRLVRLADLRRQFLKGPPPFGQTFGPHSGPGFKLGDLHLKMFVGRGGNTNGKSDLWPRHRFGSRFFFKSSSDTAHCTPSAGTSACAVHSSAFKTILRKFSWPQFLCVCPPVKPKPRPPSGRSTAQASTSARPLAATMCG